MMHKILKYVVYDAARSKIILGYGLLLFLISMGFVYFQSDADKVVISLLNIVLLIVPLVSIILGTIHYYNSLEFIELTLAQPIRRRDIFLAQYLGLSGVMALTVFIGIGLPLMLMGLTLAGLYLLLSGVLLTFTFTGLAFLASVSSNDKARGIGLALILWFYFAILYDALVLSVLLYFSDYPLEKLMLALTALNPIDLSRISIMMQLDASALMGYTGALYRNFFGSFGGTAITIGTMLLWAIIPTWLAARKFVQKDF